MVWSSAAEGKRCAEILYFAAIQSSVARRFPRARTRHYILRGGGITTQGAPGGGGGRGSSLACVGAARVPLYTVKRDLTRLVVFLSSSRRR